MYVYLITNKLNNKIYIGQTIGTVEARFADHCRRHNTAIEKAIQKYGKDNFEITVLAETDSIEQLNILEQFYIEQMNSMNPDVGYNLCAGGSNTRGYHHRPESCAKMSKSRIGIFAGEKNPFYGKHHSAEQIAKWKTERTGRRLTDSWKQHLSDTSPRKVTVICSTTGERFNSIHEASVKYNIKSTHISRVCRGIRKSCNGLKFVYDNTVPSSDLSSEKV